MFSSFFFLLVEKDGRRPLVLLSVKCLLRNSDITESRKSNVLHVSLCLNVEVLRLNLSLVKNNSGFVLLSALSVVYDCYCHDAGAELARLTGRGEGEGDGKDDLEDSRNICRSPLSR